MQEDGIDITNQSSNIVSDYKDIQFDYIISLCAKLYHLFTGDFILHVDPVLPGCFRQNGFEAIFQQPAYLPA